MALMQTAPEEAKRRQVSFSKGATRDCALKRALEVAACCSRSCTQEHIFWELASAGMRMTRKSQSSCRLEGAGSKAFARSSLSCTGLQRAHGHSFRRFEQGGFSRVPVLERLELGLLMHTSGSESGQAASWLCKSARSFL